MPKLFSWRSYIAFSTWTVVQPLIDGVLSYPRWLGLVQWLAGVAAIAAVFFGTRYKEAAPYRSKLAAAREAHPDSTVYGILLDPLTTPLGFERGDSRVFSWGFLNASLDGVEIARLDGEVLMHSAWPSLTVTTRGINVITVSGVEEWWFHVLSESGIWPSRLVLRFVRGRLERMQDLRPELIGE